MTGMSRGARRVSSSQPSSVMTTFSSCRIMRPGAYSMPGSMVITMPGTSGVSSPGMFDGGSVSCMPRPWPMRPTLRPCEPAASSTADMARNRSPDVAPGRAAAMPASVASQTASWQRRAASDSEPKAKLRSKSQK